MSFSSKVLYTGNDVITDFTVSFPYISQSHVKVYVNDILQLASMNYNWNGASTISFTTAPATGAAIEIRRVTSPTALLVDFVDGSVLNANDLDTAYLHNYYLTQEYADSFNEVINESLVNVATGAGIVETETSEIIAALVNEMLADANAANLQARITDIDANAEAIITLGDSLQVQLNTLAAGVAAAVYIQTTEPVPGVGGIPNPIPEGARWYDSDDNNHPYIYISSAWVSLDDPRIGNNEAAITVLQTETGDNAAAIVSEALLRTNADGALASTIALIGAQNVGATAFILDENTVKIASDGGDTLAQRFSTLVASDDANSASITTIQNVTIPGVQSDLAAFEADVQAEYGVDIDVNGYVTGFRIINGGTPGASAFVIRSDNFAIVDSIGGTLTEYVPFEISGGKINMRADVKISGDLVVDGTINGTALINGTIGSTKIGANAIQTTHIGADQITASEIAANSINTEQLNATQVSALIADLGAITAGTLELDGAGWIKGGQASYNTGTGYFLGYESGGYKFSIGSPTGDRITWDGSLLTIYGDVKVGEYIVDASEIMAAADTERSVTGLNPNSYTEVKKFTVDRDGAVRLSFKYKGQTATLWDENGWVRWKKNGTFVASQEVTNNNYVIRTYDWTGLSEGDVLTVEISPGAEIDTVVVEGTTYITECRLLATVNIPGDITVNTD